ncbi:low molecular weight phosphatase family protein [Aequorivita marisscotiae]|uniref:Protein-tyrosine-phosphatase n=1 Tax=Aequorivita marisscotiae TaxID=3040348 RepID=A0ABY8KY37_9FLAO|nr:protein-tyrosine-phosphatase [Aequorivita sp. Ant34-E75]WGF93893.1 protein-tyrosine-phosphatase [Aequorivita sp. Ant34-E75]
MLTHKNTGLFWELQEYFEKLETANLSEERKLLLNPITEYIASKAAANYAIRLNFICTHNSRRSHLAQIWAQTAAAYFNIDEVFCYSGGTEVTAVYPMVISTLENAGFKISKENKLSNPLFKITYSETAPPIFAFSKKYSDAPNPKSHFAAVMTCGQADAGCPFVAGSEKRFPLLYEDPKISDGTPQQQRVYKERSEQIATEMKYIFSKIAL